MEDQTNKRFWQRYASIYTPLVQLNRAGYGAVAALLGQYLRQDMTVLELACGTGQLTLLLAEQTAHWEATDFSENMVERASARCDLENVHFSVRDATALPYADGSFDAVVIANALHIMPDPAAALAEVHRVLRPAGLLLAPTFIYESGFSRNKLWLMEQMGFRAYQRWNAKELTEFVTARGFSVLENRLIPGKLFAECAFVGRKK